MQSNRILFNIVCLGIIYGANAFKIQKRILSGEFALENQFPYQVSLRRYTYVKWTSTPFTENFCGGAIISDRYIISAAHCTKEFVQSPEQLLIGYGELRFGQKSPMYKATKIINHPNFGKNDVRLMADISLIETELAIEFGKNVQPIRLAKEWIDSGNLVTVSGWGIREHGDVSEYLRHINLRTLDNKECIRQYGRYGSLFVHDSIVCASPKFYKSGVGICHGSIHSKSLYGSVYQFEYTLS